jgi:hypothetical protein
MDNIKNRMMKEPKISRTWLSGGNKNYPLAKSVLLAIPAEFTHEYHLDQPTNVLVTPTERGLLIKKLEVQ